MHSGATVWDMSYGGPNADEAQSVAIDGEGGVYMAGEPFCT